MDKAPRATPLPGPGVPEQIGDDGAARLAQAIAEALGLRESDAALVRHYLQSIDRLEREVRALRGPTGARAASAHPHDGPAPWVEPHT